MGFRVIYTMSFSSRGRNKDSCWPPPLLTLFPQEQCHHWDDMDSASKIFITSTRSRVIHKNHPSMLSTYWGVLLTFIIIIYTFYPEVCEKS